MTIKSEIKEEIWEFPFNRELFSVMSFQMKKRGTILFIMKHPKSKTQTEKNRRTGFSTDL